MAESQSKAIYLCLLDDVKLSADVTLGSYFVRSYDAQFLTRLLRGRDDLTLSETEREEFKLWSEFPWASIELAIPNKAATKHKLSGFDKLSDFDWARVTFTTRQIYGRANWPFDKLLRTLNLLKPSRGPVIPRHFYLRPAHAIQTRAQVTRDARSSPVTNFYGPDGVEGPCLWEYELEPTDQHSFDSLSADLDRSLAKEMSDSTPPNSHLRIAVHYFERGDERMTPFPSEFDAIDPLLAYEAALEALLILEEERDTGKKLVSRVHAIIGDDLPEYEVFCKTDMGKYERRRCKVTAEDLRSFVRRVFWLRSKAAHGVRTIEELESWIVHRPDDEIPDKAPVPKGPYSKLFLDGSSFPGFLVNLRELARRAIRFFCDQWKQGKTREQILDELDATVKLEL